MNKNIQNGFTLLEMISVLVLISLLLLIIFPNIINYIKKHENQVEELNSAIYKEAASSYILQNQDFFPEDNRNTFCISIKELIDSGFLKNIEDEDAINKIIQVEYDKEYKYKLVDSNKCVVKYPICTPVDEYGKTTGNVPKLDSNTSEVIFTPGDEYTCQVNSREEYTFFVLSNNEDETINLIMERNIYYDNTTGKSKPANSINTGLIAWQESGIVADGPVTIMNYLYNATKEWSNVPNININYNDTIDGENSNSYGGVFTNNLETRIVTKDGEVSATYKNLKARLPFYDEVEDSNGNNQYLYGNMDRYYWTGVGEKPSTNISGIFGYWLLSTKLYEGTNIENDLERADVVNHYGGIYKTIVDVDDESGVRPVITLSKDYMRKPIK